MKVLLLIPILFSCATTTAAKTPTTPTFKVGECGYLVDPATGRGKKDDVVKVEKSTFSGYVYRWMTYQGEWAVGTDHKTTKQFERLFRKIKCPSEKTNTI